MSTALTILENETIFLADIGAAGGLHDRFISIDSNLLCILFEPETSLFKDK